ncbi:SGNH/GDSL hydrolase family protein [Microbacterium sp. zg-YB36]|uniref:SGNH/GDSL hydrolase family protein n=1 Tax=Microbacterium sp. zg-YB36 TaxID=2969407 RepID=UPI00214CD040|nr:SGNH/GDSL hydrolase family protein [Microbacterium sp. zg-YB36]MDL5352335.1 SGNH/GDSL hydrolase family protein [Microbacterium sp. zg-YB36]
MLWIVAGIVVVAVVAAAGVFVVRKASSVATVAALCDSIRDQVDERGAVIEVPGESPPLGILGDSWTTGDTLAEYRDAWPFVLADETGGEVVVAGQGGTGFSNAGYCGDGAFPARVRALASAQPGRVIVAGGLNDVGLDATGIRSGFSATLDALDGIPVVVVGPVDVPGREGEAEVDATLSEACDDLGVPYVSALGWEVETGADGVHPTAGGARQYAELVAAIN